MFLQRFENIYSEFWCLVFQSSSSLWLHFTEWKKHIYLQTELNQQIKEQQNY